VSGGDINEAFQIITNTSDLFIKVNDHRRFLGLFEEEAKSINFIRNTGTIDTPKVLRTGNIGEHSYLLLEWITEGSRSSQSNYHFGRKLAGMHSCSDEYFGWNSDNYLGTVIQNNQKKNTWGEFFVENRLETFLRILKDQGVLELKIQDAFYNRMQKFFPEEKPALLHGDLWQGNYMINQNGECVLIDPATYFGHREIDLGMTRMFGGFSAEFYQGYQENYPLEKGWEGRLEIAQLIPLLVHAILFQGSYVSQVEAVLKKY
jgi:fructosamine-3-kinase